MPDVTVHPHGGRWAVAEPGAASPTREYETREAAESAARELARGGAVEVLEEDPSTLSEPARPGVAEEREPPRDEVDALRDRERLRTEQGGL
jgi:Uncharacterized protein conserved in bacteria (DUF2188)